MSIKADDLDAEQRAYFAGELLNNPLFPLITAKLEADAINRGVHAAFTDHETRQAAFADVRAIRTFRQTCEAMLRTTQAAKVAPA